jgi:uncharacterized protein YfbU (UPF0304 family)/uncharacterized protein (UPF0332 family)
MKSNIEKFEKDLERLATQGVRLELGMLKDLDILDEIPLVLEKIEPLDFYRNYEQWYSESLQVIKQLLPDRFLDFRLLYKDEKRKFLTYENYTVSDFIIGAVNKNRYEVFANQEAAYPKFQQQLDILDSARKRLKSSLFDIKQILQADLFDSELDSARELLKKGFLRASGAIAGVLIEKHLRQVIENHNLSIRKKNPTIADLNDKLKSDGVYDVATWRFIQRLGDLRNLCDHYKEKEPTKDNVEDLLNGTDKIIKTI